jgi:hypothetical protein
MFHPKNQGGTFILERNVTRIEFKDGKFKVSFADSIDHLRF